MRLSSIKLAGFKSFVDPMGLPLRSNLTAIVGPNGCGKSNIIDAVRWVLGESSMKQLRSDTMEDVIFNGSKTRKPAGRAAIELSFDNSDGALQGPYAAYAEITVRRELTRDGASQYFLNGARCLKRDVTDLFLGTGLGARSGYAIIEQGMVSNLIQAQPEELRQWLEEAAGISKYKERRRDTENRIRQTRENLARLGDLRSELQARLETLKKQATNAEKYKEFKEQERKLKAELLGLRLRAVSAQCEAREGELAELGRGVEAAKAAVAAAQDARGRAEAAGREAAHALSEQQNRAYEADAALSRLEQNLQHARELKALAARELQQMAQQLDELERREAGERARLAELERSLGELEAAAGAAAAEEEAARVALAAAEQSALSDQARWDQFQQRAQAPMFRLEGERARVPQLERALAQAEERLQRLTAERSDVDAAPFQTSLFDADSELEGLNRTLAEGQARAAEMDRAIEGLRDARATEEGALHQARESLQAARGRLSSLETLQQAALREDDAELSAWLRDQGLGGVARLASVLKVERGWEAALEHVLGGLLQAPLLPGFAARIAQLPTPPRSGLTLVDEAGGAGTGPAGRLAAKVQGPAAVAEILASIHVAATAEEAVQRLPRLPPGESVITPDGAWRGHGWARFPRADEDRAGVLARDLLLKELRTEIDSHARAAERHGQALAGIQQRLERAEAQRREYAASLDAGRERQAQRLAFRQAQAVRLEQAEHRTRQLQDEISVLTTGADELRRELAEGRRRLAGLEDEAQRLEQERGALQQAVARHREAQQPLRAGLSEAQGRRSRAEVELAGRRSTLEALRAALADLAERRTALVARRAEKDREARALETPEAGQAAALAAARGAVEGGREALRAGRARLEAAEQAVNECVRAAREAEFAQDAARERLQQAQLEAQGLSVRRQTLEDQIAEAGFVRDALLAGLPAEASVEAWEERLGSLGRRVERLGPINLAAIQELEESQGRETYLAEQNADLTGALETLEAAIRKIDAETRERFRETFQRVDAIFRERFPRLFGGGEASLELTGDNLLETGVRVMARPPGKRNSSIQLLSGGEKAMTAVALLLALFDLNPAPFCLLDEVDAPLDDANVGRFCDVIREMSGTVQFVIITHNKITMELAEQLHGVTMQEPGVSRMVSVDLQQAVDLAARAAAEAESAAP